jgi:hypothetical protein
LLRKAARRHDEALIYTYSFADAYGFRPSLPGLLYLSPWEFAAHWKVQRLHAPLQKDYTLTRWIPPMTTEAAEEFLKCDAAFVPVPGTHYEVNESASKPGELDARCPDAAQYAVYGRDESLPQLQRFRSNWILRRREACCRSTCAPGSCSMQTRPFTCRTLVTSMRCSHTGATSQLTRSS